MIRSSDIAIAGDVYRDLVGTWECLRETFLLLENGGDRGANIRVLI